MIQSSIYANVSQCAYSTEENKLLEFDNKNGYINIEMKHYAIKHLLSLAFFRTVKENKESNTTDEI